jgi:hypothetical protein
MNHGAGKLQIPRGFRCPGHIICKSRTKHGALILRPSVCSNQHSKEQPSTHRGGNIQRRPQYKIIINRGHRNPERKRERKEEKKKEKEKKKMTPFLFRCWAVSYEG